MDNMSRRDLLKSIGIVLSTTVLPVEVFANDIITKNPWVNVRAYGAVEDESNIICRSICKIDAIRLKYSSGPLVFVKDFTNGMVKCARWDNYKVDYITRIELGILEIKDRNNKKYKCHCTLVELYGEKGKMPATGKVQIREGSKVSYMDYNATTFDEARQRRKERIKQYLKTKEKDVLSV